MKGLQCQMIYNICGGLLPRHFTLTFSGGIFSVALSILIYFHKLVPGITRFIGSMVSGLSSLLKE
jgi:hypothetical protein